MGPVRARAATRGPAAHRPLVPGRGQTSKRTEQSWTPDEPWCSSLRGSCRRLAARFFARPRAVGMHLDAGAVQRDDLNLDGENLFFLQAGEHPFDHARFAPAVEPHVDRVPATIFLGQTPPLAAVFQHKQQRVEQQKIIHPHVAALTGQAVFDALELFQGQFHPTMLPAATDEIN